MIEKYKNAFKNKPLKIALLTVLGLFALRILFVIVMSILYAHSFSFALAYVFNGAFLGFVIYFPFWFLVGASLYEWGLHMSKQGKPNALKFRTILYLALGILAIVIAGKIGITALVILSILAFLSYKNI